MNTLMGYFDNNISCPVLCEGPTFNFPFFSVSHFLVSILLVSPCTHTSHNINVPLFCRPKNQLCHGDFISNEDAQLYTFLHQINQVYQKHTSNSPPANNDIMSKFINNYQKYPNKTQRIFLNRHKALKGLDKYKWLVKYKHCKDVGDVIITIKETYRQVPTSGGSSFTILQTSAHTKDFCPTMDLFNGTYIAKCSIHENNTIIKGMIQFVNFTAFTKTTKPFHKEILKFHVNQNLDTSSVWFQTDGRKSKSCNLSVLI